MNKLNRIAIVPSCLLAATLAGAETRRTVLEVPVTVVEPLVPIVSPKIPHESCWDERVRVVREGGNHSATPALIGAVVGGVVGGSLGHNSRYQPVIVGAGAVLGASVGNDVAHSRNSQSYYVTEQRCEVDYELRDEESVYAYRVSYRYGDSIYQTETRSPPGETIKIYVDVTPAI